MVGACISSLLNATSFSVKCKARSEDGVGGVGVLTKEGMKEPSRRVGE